MVPMLTLKEFMDEMLVRTEYNGKKILEREIGYGHKPDVYLFYGETEGDTKSPTRFYSCFDEYEKYKEAYKRFADWLSH